MILPDLIIRRREGVDALDLSDCTDCVQVGPSFWAPGAVDELVIPMDPEPTPDEQTAIRRRLATVDAADEDYLLSLLALTPSSDFERTWLTAQLRAYGETT